MKATELSVRPSAMSIRSVRTSGVGAVLYALAGFALLCAGAKVCVPVPYTDVPMTLQLLAVLLIGLFLPTACAVSGVLLYVACGAAGLPVFANPAGLLGPTGGYIVGFVPAVWLVARLSGGRCAGSGRLMLACVAGVLVVFLLGVSWRTWLFAAAGAGERGVWVAVTTGFLPFAGKAVVESALAVAAVRATAPRDTRSVKQQRSV